MIGAREYTEIFNIVQVRLRPIMPLQNPPNADDVRKVVEERVRALESLKGAQETVTIEWRAGSAAPHPSHLDACGPPALQP